MNFVLAALVVLSTSSFSFAKTPKVVEHRVTEAETAWFLASLYYGSGLEYPRILSANDLKRPDDVKDGMRIRIEDPKYNEDQAGFSERYKQLWQARQKALGLTAGKKRPDSKIMIPAQSIRDRDRTPSLSILEEREANPNETGSEH